MAVVVMLIDEPNASKSAQIVERLFKRQSKALSELSGKDNHPLQFVMIAVSHNLLRYLFHAASLRLSEDHQVGMGGRT